MLAYVLFNTTSAGTLCPWGAQCKLSATLE